MDITEKLTACIEDPQAVMMAQEIRRLSAGFGAVEEILKAIAHTDVWLVMSPRDRRKAYAAIQAVCPDMADLLTKLSEAVPFDAEM